MTEISRLRVGNEDFLVSSMIERCPRSMMMRELIKNAIEAATSGEGVPTIDVRPVVVDGVRKLGILNSGPGMSAEELIAMCDIASSIRKANGLNDNFGMGAKVATLPSNRHGVRYRSNHQGRVSQVVIGKRGDVYGRLVMVGPDSEPSQVLDVTEGAAAEGYDLAADWTEVVLLGDSADQDTVADPYNGDPGSPEDWIADAIRQRFFTLPAGLILTLAQGCSGPGGTRQIGALAQEAGSFSHYEAVRTPDGIILHYYNDDRSASAPGRLTAGVIHRGEIYETLSRTDWSHEAPKFGVAFSSRTLAVLIELPDDFAIRTDGYRQMLHYVGNLQHRVTPRDFAALAAAHRPAWLLEIQARLGPDRSRVGQHRLEMEALFRSLRLSRRFAHIASPSHKAPPSGPASEGAACAAPEDDAQYEVAPEIIPLTDLADIQERGLEGRAARFYPETHQIFVNELYDAFVRFRAALETLQVSAPDQDQVRRLSYNEASKYVTRAICRKVAFGIAKRDVWQAWDIEQALSPFSLTLAADGAEEMLADAAAAVSAALAVETPQDERVKGRAPIVFEQAPEEDFSAIPYDPADGPRIILPSYMRRSDRVASLG